MSKSKDIGTRAETEVVRAFHRAGLDAHRSALAGALDQGDVHALGGRLVIEVKAGAQTTRPSWKQLRDWQAETEREADRVLACGLPLLVVRRHGSGNAEDWTAHVDLADLGAIIGVTIVGRRTSIAMRLGDLLDLLVDAGHGGQP